MESTRRGEGGTGPMGVRGEVGGKRRMGEGRGNQSIRRYDDEKSFLVNPRSVSTKHEEGIL